MHPYSVCLSVCSTDKELLSVRDRLERDVETLRYGLQEQKDKVDILDHALTNAQANVVRLEEEVSRSLGQTDGRTKDVASWFNDTARHILFTVIWSRTYGKRPFR